MKSRLALLVGVLVIASMLLTACPAPAPQVVEKVVEVEKKVEVIQTVEVGEEGRRDPGRGEDREATPAPEAKPIVSWFQYDQGNVDPKSDERVGNEYLRKTMPASTRRSRASGSGITSLPPGRGSQPNWLRR